MSFYPPSALSPVIAYPGKNLTSGQQLHLICGIGLNMSSDLQLKWVPPEQSLQSDLVHANFTITEVSTRDSGKWRCELWQGSTKLTSEEITLKIGECRKWEENRKYDMGMTLWPQSFTAETWFYMVHALYCKLFDHSLQNPNSVRGCWWSSAVLQPLWFSSSSSFSSFADADKYSLTTPLTFCQTMLE